MLVSKEKCVGCGLCYEVCPFDSIKMDRDAKGFLHPIINLETCKNCKLCEKNCPQISENNCVKSNQESGYKCFVAINKDASIWYASSSGGVISALINSMSAHKDSWVCAAKFDQNFSVKHELIKAGEDFSQYRKSKYVQSDVFQCFSDIKQKIEEGNEVIFIGTPCQVDAIKKYLPNSPNLFTIDLLCTGVGSPALLEVHIDFLQKQRGKIVSSYDMRSKVQLKDKSWNIMDCRIGYSDGSFEKKPIYKKMFKETFYKHISLRESCYSCKYKCRERAGDITVGDWWGTISQISEENKGASAVIINTEKGNMLFQEAQKFLHFFPVTYEEIIKQQPALREREMPIQDIAFSDEKELIKFLKKNATPAPVVIVKSIIKACLPKGMKQALSRYLHGDNI